MSFSITGQYPGKDKTSNALIRYGTNINIMPKIFGIIHQVCGRLFHIIRTNSLIPANIIHQFARIAEIAIIPRKKSLHNPNYVNLGMESK